MSYSISCTSGSGGAVSFFVDYIGSFSVSEGETYSAGGFSNSVSFTAIPNTGYEFSGWTVNGVSEPANPYSWTSGTNITISASFTQSSGGGGGGGDEPYTPPVSSDYRYNATCYDMTNGVFISGHEQNSDTSRYFTAPSLSGYDYKGYVYYDSYVDCVEFYYEYERFDGTSTTGEIVGSNTHLVFFYEYVGTDESTLSVTVPQNVKVPVSFRISSSGTYTFYTEGSLDTIGYLTYANVTSNPENNYIAWNDDGGSGNNFLITATLSAGSYKIWVCAYSDYSGSTTLHISPKTGTFTGSISATGTTTATATASFANGDSGFSYYRYVRVKLGNTWKEFTRETTSKGGSTSSFTVNLTGLSSNTTYTYEIRLYYSTSSNPGQTASNYTDTYIYCNGSFTTNQSATGLMIYVGGWKDCLPYVYTSIGWKRAYSRMYINEWKGR